MPGPARRWSEVTITRGTRARLKALSKVIAETGATANQVVLAWLLGGELPVVPLFGVSSVASAAFS